MTTLQRLREDRRVQRGFWSVTAYVLLALFLVFFLFPVFWMILTSFKPDAEIEMGITPLGIEKPTLENFRYLLNETNFKVWIRNSVFVAAATTTYSVIAGTCAAYALVRFRLLGGRLMGMAIFVTYLLPQTMLFIPMAQIMRELDLYGKIGALVVVYPTMMVPFCTWLMMGYFRTLPVDIEESARVDGATRWTAFFKVTLPLAVPGIISAAIFTFTLSWSEYLYALVLVPQTAQQTVPVGVPNSLTSGDVSKWGSLMSAALLGSLPVVLVYGMFMRFFVRGMTVGAVKG
jgi:multiple sugar transport system permease protein